MMRAPCRPGRERERVAIMRRCVRLVLLCLAGCGASYLSESGGARPTESGPLRIDRIFFAQQHVLEPESPHFKLVGGLDALVKVQVYSDTPQTSPYVFAVLELDGKRKDFRLLGPETLPARPDVDPVLMPHKYEDSFTAMIPGAWIRKGLAVAVELREYDYRTLHVSDRRTTSNQPRDRIKVLDRRVIEGLKVGAPSRLVMNMFDFQYFGLGKDGDHPTGWREEFEAKLPVAEMVVHRVRDVMLDEIVWMPFADNPAMLLGSKEEFKERTGREIDGEQGMALRWGMALKRAGGTCNPWRLYYANICGMVAGGQAGGFRACGNIHRHGVIIHEVGHTFGLPHWNRSKHYPYKSTMYGSEPGEPASANAGPVWAFDVRKRDFIAPHTMHEGKIRWKRDPMQGGGQSWLKNHMYNHFSDYSVHRIREFFERRVVRWNEELGQYARWNDQSGEYDIVVDSDGVYLPIERDVDIVSLLVTASLVTEEANIVYAPIGPYKAGLIRRFDASSAEDRARAKTIGHGYDRSNVFLRVTQGGRETTYLMPLTLSEDDDPLKAFHVAAINLPARDGEVTTAELVYAPGVVESGIGADARTLFTRSK